MALPPPTNNNVALQQNADVMQAMQGGSNPMDDPQMQQTQQMLIQAMNQFGVTPEQLKQLGQLAEMTIKDKQAYPLFLQKLRDFGMADAERMQGEVDYQALAIFATAAKMV